MAFKMLVRKGFLLVAMFHAAWVIRLLLTVKRSLIPIKIPGAEGNRIGRVIILDSSPPKPPNDSSDPFNKSFGEKNSGHVVDTNRGKNQLDVGEFASMVKLVGFNSGEFGTELVDNEVISFIPIPVTKDHGVAKVHSIRK